MTLDTPFEKKSFIQFIKEFLPDFLPEEREVRTAENSLLKKVCLLGTSKACNVAIFEAGCSETDSGKRIAITQNAFRMLRDHQIRNAIIAIYDGSGQWRLSLLTSSLELIDGKIIKKDSNPRRYSYRLGIGTKINTPYKYLISKGSVSDLDSLRERFSVEVVNKQFYDSIATLFTELVGGERNGKVYPGLLKIKDGAQGSILYQEFAVRLVGRIVFCWFLKEKKSKAGIPLIPESILSLDAIHDRTEYYHGTLEPLFFEILNKREKDRPEELRKKPFDIIPYLNGGLFNPQRSDYYRYNSLIGSGSSDLLSISNEWFIKLFEVLSQYNFTIDENTSYDVDLSIDPEMLGRIFENLLAEINPETGESARKSTGSFYTPREIVEYMVDESLFYFLMNKTEINSDKLRSIISYDKDYDYENPLTKQEKIAIINALASLKVLDPACGSGAFPIGILQKIVFILQQADEKSELWLEKQLEGIRSLELRHEVEEKYHKENYDYLRKLGVIRESIFGVDIQTIATEIAKLRSFLTLIIEEEVDDKADNRGIRPLPNLDFKFVAADSLVSLPDDEGKIQMSFLEDANHIDQLRKIRDVYFMADADQRIKLRYEFDRVQKEMLEKTIDEFLKIPSKRYSLLSRWKPFENVKTDWFDPEWMFGVERFDIIISNPPYIGEKGHKEVLFDNLKKTYLGKRFYLGKMDIFYFFFHLGLDFLDENGILSFITTNYYPTADGALKLRKDINSRAEILELINFNEYKIFESALGQHNMITVLQKSTLHKRNIGTQQTYVTIKGGPSGEELYRFLRQTSNGAIYAYIHKNKLFDGDKYYIRFNTGNENINTVLDKIALTGTPLGEICNINQGIVTGADKFTDAHKRKFPNIKATKGEGIFVFTDSKLSDIEEQKTIIKPWYKNSDIQCYFTSQSTDLELLYTNGVVKPSVNVLSYLERFKPILQNRREFRSGMTPWYNLHWAREQEIFDGPKIVAPQRSNRNTFGYNTIPWYASADVYFLTPKTGKLLSLKYLLGILNSKLMFVWLYLRGKRKGESLELYRTPLSQIPIAKTDDNIMLSLEKIVDQILELKEKNPKSDMSALEAIIDSMVFDIYKLTYDERKAVINLCNSKGYN